MRVSWKVSASNNLLCEIVSRSGFASANIVFLVLLISFNLSNIVSNSFGISNKLLLGTSD